MVRNSEGQRVDPVPFVVVAGTAFGGCYAFFPVYFLSFGLSAAAALVGTTAIFLALAAIAYVRLVRNARPEVAAELPPGRRLEQIFYHALVVTGAFVLLTGLLLVR